jgi:hypothetical protein
MAEKIAGRLTMYKGNFVCLRIILTKKSTGTEISFCLGDTKMTCCEIYKNKIILEKDAYHKCFDILSKISNIELFEEFMQIPMLDPKFEREQKEKNFWYPDFLGPGCMKCYKSSIYEFEFVRVNNDNYLKISDMVSQMKKVIRSYNDFERQTQNIHKDIRNLKSERNDLILKKQSLTYQYTGLIKYVNQLLNKAQHTSYVAKAEQYQLKAQTTRQTAVLLQIKEKETSHKIEQCQAKIDHYEKLYTSMRHKKVHRLQEELNNIRATLLLSILERS